MKVFSKKIWQQIGMVAAFVWAILLGGVLLRRWQKLRKRAATPRFRPDFQLEGVSPQIKGLTQEQVDALLPTSIQAPDDQSKQQEFRKKILRETLFTIFNFNLFAMLVVNLLLDNLTGAILNLILLAISMALRIFQITYTKRHMDEIVQSLRPRASVIRDGQLRSIDPMKIVPGDYLVIGNGDEILVDGKLAGDAEITIEQIKPSGTTSQARKAPGETLEVGSYCVKGRGIYIANEGGWLRHQTGNEYQLELMHSERTPFQRLTENVLRILLGIVLVLSVVLLVDTILRHTMLTNAVYRDAFSIIFGVAPTGLFMILILKNIVGVLRIARRGALVYDPQSIETLAQVKTLCISKESLVSGLQVTLEPVESVAGEDEPLSENIIRQIIGDMVHSSLGYSTTMQMLAEALPGEQRQIREIAPYWNRQGWHGLTFEDADRQGTYILGQQEVLAEQLRKEKLAVKQRVEAVVTDAGQGIGKFLQRFARRDRHPDNSQNDSSTGELSDESGLPRESGDAVPAETQPTRRQRARATLLRWLTPIEDLPENQDQPSEQADDEYGVLLAYLPEAISFYNHEGEVVLPDDLIPLARVQVKEMIHPETQQTLKALLDEGMRIKILAADPPEKVAPIVKALGIPEEELSMVSGADLYKKSNLAETIRATRIFGDLTPAQKAQVVESLRAQDAYVMMIGSAVSDVPALRQAYLGVTTRSSAQAALHQTDIVLLDESIAVLPRVFTEGQRMINGVLTTFKLYLSQVLMQLLLILLLLFKVLEHFPYQPAQGGVVSVFTMAIPNIFLVVWSSAKRLTQESMRRQLTRFIIPVALTLVILVGGISVFFSERSGDAAYADLAVAYTLLLAGWIRVFFVQPPHAIWEGGAPLRGDLRVYRVVLGSALFLLSFLVFPFFQESFKITLLASWEDFFIVVSAVLAWAITLRIIWQIRLFREPLVDQR